MNEKQKFYLEYLGSNYVWNVRKDNGIEVVIEQVLANNKKVICEHCIVVSTKGIIYYSEYNPWSRLESKYEIDPDEARKLIKLKLKFSAME